MSAGEDGSLRLDDAALEAQRHVRRAGVRCYCTACKADRERVRAAALEPYLQLLLSESPADAEEIARVRRELPGRRAAAPAAQPWQPKAARNTAVAGEIRGERPAA